MSIKALIGIFTVILMHYNCHALFEDQIGKFDWKLDFVGEVKFSKFDNGVNFHEIVYVATEQNVLSAINLKSGEIKWRNVLEKGDGGVINVLHVVSNLVFVVSGTDMVIIRGWNAKYGYLTHQWSIPSKELDLEGPQQVLWLAHEINLCRVIIQSNNILISNFRIYSAEYLNARIIKAPVSVEDKCTLSKTTLLCLNEQGQTIIVNLTQTNDAIADSDSSIQVPGSERIYDVRASPYNEKTAFVVSAANKNILFANINQSYFNLIDSISAKGDIYIQLLDLGASLLEVTVEPVSETELVVNGYIANPKRTAFSHRYPLKHPVGSITISNADCYKQTSGIISCALLLTSSDGALIYLNSPGKVEWVREEGLSSIITVEFVELPMSDTEAEMQTEFDAKELLDYVLQAADIFNMFTRRISSHVFQLQKFLLSLSGILEKSFSVENNDNKLVRDYFNLHKIILLITKHMKIYAVDNISKEIHWSYSLSGKYEAFPAPSEDFEVRVPLFIQRTYRHYPHPMQCAILVRKKDTQNGVIISFNPVTGKFDSPIELNYKIKQAMLIPKTTPEDHLQGIILMDDNDVVHVFPERTMPILTEVASNLYIHVANAKTCEVNGYTFSSDLTNMTLVPAWNMKCAGKIIKISNQNHIEKVHSQGRVLADRSVLYKYINPNLIAIVSQDINPEDQKSMLTLYFVDSVTGALVNGDVRYRASDPVHLVHSENWIVLMYFNHKTRRTEVVTYELYEGKTQRNSTAFSSIQTKNLRPIIDSRAYILPTSFIEAARETITEKGITSKHVLVALSTGNIVELPWVILDPRRPFASTPETKEEGVIPYMPEIPIPTETMINYNRTLHRTRGIVTSPSGLESTSLVFVYGLDLFYTRTAPSKTFDLLKEDFDYTLIIIVLVLLIVSTFITKHFAYKRALRQVWR